VKSSIERRATIPHSKGRVGKKKRTIGKKKDNPASIIHKWRGRGGSTTNLFVAGCKRPKKNAPQQEER